MGHFTGPHQLLVQGMGASGLAAPLDEGFDKAVRAAHHAEVAVPLPLRVQVRVFAVADSLAGADHHRHLAQVGAVDAHAALEQAHAGVKQDGLHLAGNPGVTQCHIHGQGFVPTVNVGGAVGLVDFLAGQRLPNRRPFRAGGRYDVVDAQVAEGFQDGVAAVLG